MDKKINNKKLKNIKEPKKRTNPIVPNFKSKPANNILPEVGDST
jgi:hypothetical protein